MVTELIELNRIRLEGDLSYDKLGRMVGANRQTIYRILTTPNARVHDRTLFKIQRFLAKHQPAGRPTTSSTEASA